jgi:predicted RNA-binding protein with PUA-like domain
MKDALGIPLKVGDTVYLAHSHTNTNFSGLTKVLKLTSKRVTVWDPYFPDTPSKLSVQPERLLKVSDQIKANQVNYPELYL